MRIAIIGKKNAGKDALASALNRVEARPFDFERVAFADPMKEMLHVGFGIPHEILYGDAAAKEQVDPRFGVTYRHMLQTLGTEWGREHIHQDVWVIVALTETIPRLEREKGYRDWVVTDVRFLNEARLLKEAGFTLVRITRPGSSTGVSENHQSETEQDEIEVDVTIDNSGTLEDLERAARLLVFGHKHGLT